MFGNGAPMRAGGAFNLPNFPQMDKSMHTDHDLSRHEPLWLKEFYKMGNKPNEKQIPTPCMVGIYPCMRGGLNPYGDAYLRDGYQWLYKPNGQYHLFKDNLISVPSDAQYRIHFKNIIKKRSLVIKIRKCNARDCDIITVVKNIKE